MLRKSVIKRSPRAMFYGALLATVGGMLYRFDPTTTAFQPKAGAIYFPSVIELLISIGFMSMGIAIFIFLAKVLPILPGSIKMWHANGGSARKECPLPASYAKAASRRVRLR